MESCIFEHKKDLSKHRDFLKFLTLDNCSIAGASCLYHVFSTRVFCLCLLTFVVERTTYTVHRGCLERSWFC